MNFDLESCLNNLIRRFNMMDIDDLIFADEEPRVSEK
jgi:hypothetical protein